MPYESFKKALIAEFETTRDLEVTKSNYPKYDTLFSLSDAKDKLYNTILDKFEKIAICNSENLIYELCQKHDVFYERNMGNRENYDFEIEIVFTRCGSEWFLRAHRKNVMFRQKK